MEQLLLEVVKALNRISLSLDIISVALITMLLVKDMGHDAAEEIKAWRQQSWKK